MAAEASWPVIGVAWNGRGGFVASSLLPGLSLAFFKALIGVAWNGRGGFVASH